MRFLTIALLPLFVLFLVVRFAFRLVFLPLHDLVMFIAFRLGPLRLPFLILCTPIVLMGVLLSKNPGRLLEGDYVRPTFTLPTAFERGAWQASEEQGDRFAQFQVGEGADVATMQITAGPPLHMIQREDEMMARAIEKSLQEPAKESGMRWTGIRLRTHFFAPGPVTSIYYVWNDAKPDEQTVQITFHGSEEHELLADAFASSALAELPEVDVDAPESTPLETAS